MRLKEIMEVAVARNDPEMDDYNDDRSEKARDMKDAPYYVAWYAQSWEWYGDGAPEDGQGRYKPKGNGGRIVAINISSYDTAVGIADMLDSAYENGDFEDKNVYGKQGIDGYVLDYQDAEVSSMSKMDDYDKETIKHAHPNFKPVDYAGK